MGETISYSSGGRSLPDVASLVREARERVTQAEGFHTGILPAALGYTEAARFARWHSMDVSALCDALEERQREVERLKEQVSRLDAYITHRDYDREILDENTRLREEVGRLRTEADLLNELRADAVERGREVAGMRDHWHEEARRLQGLAFRRLATIEELEGHLDQALRQWRMYADTERQFDENWIEGAGDEEAQLYHAALKAARRSRREERDG